MPLHKWCCDIFIDVLLKLPAGVTNMFKPIEIISEETLHSIPLNVIMLNLKSKCQVV